MIQEVIHSEKELTSILYEKQNKKVLDSIDYQIKVKMKAYYIMIGDGPLYIKDIDDVVKEIGLLMLTLMGTESPEFLLIITSGYLLGDSHSFFTNLMIDRGLYWIHHDKNVKMNNRNKKGLFGV